jgi:hypothetical protein
VAEGEGDEFEFAGLIDSIRADNRPRAAALNNICNKA